MISWIETFQVNHIYSEKRWILALGPQAQMEHAWLFVQAAAQQQRWYVRHGSVKSLRCVWVTQWHPWLKNWVIWTKKCQWYGHFGVHGLSQSGSIGNHDNTLLYSLPDILRLYNKKFVGSRFFDSKVGPSTGATEQRRSSASAKPWLVLGISETYRPLDTNNLHQ